MGKEITARSFFEKILELAKALNLLPATDQAGMFPRFEEFRCKDLLKSIDKQNKTLTLELHKSVKSNVEMLAEILGRTPTLKEFFKVSGASRQALLLIGLQYNDIVDELGLKPNRKSPQKTKPHK